MKIANTRAGWTLVTLGLVVASGGTALADDSELFLAGEGTLAEESQARPNILFIIDTSGSMDAEVKTQVSYDPAINFDGNYRSDRIYWSFSSSAPGAGTDRYFDKSVNNCQASKSALDGLGVYEGDLLAWRENTRRPWRSRWLEFNSSRRDRIVECKDDAGSHGASSGSFWAADGSGGPYSGDDNAEPSWTQRYHLFDGNYLNWLSGGGTITQTRLEIVQDVTNNLLDNLTDVNVGLMRFNIQSGGPIAYAMSDVDVYREDLKKTVSELDFDLYTPLSETMYEAHQYFTGGRIAYGEGYEHESVPASRAGGLAGATTYDSPIDFACQKNYIILLTDGAPTRDTGATNAIEGLPGFAELTGQSSCERIDSDNDNGLCLDELAGYMHNADLSDFYGEQNVTTYTVGFTVDLDLLESTAQRGGGDYYLADNTATLANALTRIAVSILDDATTFVAPVVPVNSFNRTQSLSDVYVSVFNPSSTVRWPGNLKKYKLVNSSIIDANATLAVDPETGFFRQDSRSFWSDVVDGDRPTAGGAAAEQPDYQDRKVYINFSNGDLTTVGNTVSVDNASITRAALGAGSDLERNQAVQWMLGQDVYDDNDNGEILDNRRQMGDAMHGSPVPVIYGGTAAEPELVVYTTTNDGYLHAIDPKDGTELWSFIPERLLPLQYAKLQDEVSSRRLYGLDGQIRATILNNDFVGGISGNERVILLFGMRRGGNAIFALDVTDKTTPKVLWEIDDTTQGFEDLGQTWSTPQVSRVRVGNAVKDVAMFGGGYDTGQDAEDYRTDATGNAIFMVDILTGEKIWSAGRSDDHDLVLEKMEHSIPAPLRLVDLNGDNFVDRVYTGDMGGRLWRFDIYQGAAQADLGQGGLLAELGAAGLESPTPQDVRRFYNQVDAVNVQGFGNSFISLNLGSGYRAHPLDREIDEEFYSVRDFKTSGRMTNGDYGEPVTRDELVDVTDLTDAEVAADDAGWRLSLVASGGEKNLSRSITSAGVVKFTTFAPGVNANACTATQGQNRLYQVNVINGFPVYDSQGLLGGDDLKEEDRYEDLTQGGIVPGVIGTPDGTDCIGLNCAESANPPMPTRSYWTQDGAR